MPSMKEILTAAAQGSFAEVDGIGNVVEQMYRDLAALQAMHENFLRKYGGIVERRIEPAAPPPVSHQPGPMPAYAPPPNASGVSHPSRPLTPDQAAELDASVRRLARTFAPNGNGGNR